MFLLKQCCYRFHDLIQTQFTQFKKLPSKPQFLKNQSSNYSYTSPSIFTKVFLIECTFYVKRFRSIFKNCIGKVLALRWFFLDLDVVQLNSMRCYFLAPVEFLKFQRVDQLFLVSRKHLADTFVGKKIQRKALARL